MSVEIKTKYELSGNHDDDCFLSVDDTGQALWDILMSCHHQGQCDDDCEEAARFFEIKDYVAAVNHLIECGIERDRFCEGIDYPQYVKSEDQITDKEAVLQYYLWLLAGDIQERSDEEE